MTSEYESSDERVKSERTKRAGDISSVRGPESPVEARPVAHDASGREEEISLVDLAGVLLRHRRGILTLSLLGPFLFVAFTVLQSRSYTATASFMPQTGQSGASSRLASLAGQFGVEVPVGGESVQSPEFYADLLTSRQVLSAVVADTFSVSDTVGFSPRGLVRGTLPEILQLELEGPEQRRAEVIRWLRERAVSTATGRETGVVELSVRTPWPELSGRIAARLIELVNEFNLETRQSQAAAGRRFIEERLVEARTELRAVENELEDFLRNNRGFENSPELLFRHDRLQRRVAMRQQVVTSLSEAYEQARISEVRNTPVITVVEPAEAPVAPDSRRLLVKAVLGGVLGGMLGVLSAVGREFVNRTRQDEAEKYAEISSLWREAKADLTRPIRFLRGS